MSWKSSMNMALDNINKQYSQTESYFNEAGTAYESQYKSLYGNTMGDAINSMANTGVFDSPVSENALNRQRTSLAETYATGKSALAGQKMQALGSIDAQKISYYQSLASMQQSASQAKKANTLQLVSAASGVVGGLITGGL